MKKFIYIVMALGLVFAGVSANAAKPAKKSVKTVKTTKSKSTTKKTTTASATAKTRVKATSKYVVPTHELSASEKQAYNYYIKATNFYNENRPVEALKALDMCDRALGKSTARSSYLRAKIAYAQKDYSTARAASQAYLNSNPIQDNGYAEILNISTSSLTYFNQQDENKAVAQVKANEAAAQAAAKKESDKEAELAAIEKARAEREARRANMGNFVAKINASLDSTRQVGTREAYQDFIQKHPFGKASVTAEEEMLAKWPYPTKQLKGSKYGYVDKTGKFVIKPKYENAMAFQEDMARVGNGSLYGFVNESGKEVIPIKYRTASNFNYGYAAVKDVNGKSYFIDKQGNKLGNTDYRNCQTFSEGLAAVSDSKGQFGYINNTGATVIPNQFASAGTFSAGRAVVGKKVGNAMKYAYVKKDGTMLTDFIYDDAQSFQVGLARIKSNGKYGLIDMTGSPITVCQYDYITEFRNDGYARARRNGVEVLIDRNGDTFSQVNGNIIEVKFKN